MTITVSNHDERLKSGALTGTGLLLDGHDLHHLILQLGADKVVDDLRLLDGKGEQVDLFKRIDLI